MEILAWNPLLGRLQTIIISFTAANTTWFDDTIDDCDIRMITDTEYGLLISEASYNYPVLIGGKTRASIDHNKQKANNLRDEYC